MASIITVAASRPSATCPVVIVPWECTEQHSLTWAQFDQLCAGHEEHIAEDPATKHRLEASFLKRTHEEARKLSVRVIKPETSEAMRFVMRLNAEKGSASRANVPGFFVGGKTGTAEKVIAGRYSKEKKLTTFMAVAPADKPRYLFLTIIDEPQPTPDSMGYSTSGWNASPTTGKIIERVGPMLGLEPRFDPPVQPFPAMARAGAWGTR